MISETLRWLLYSILGDLADSLDYKFSLVGRSRQRLAADFLVSQPAYDFFRFLLPGEFSSHVRRLIPQTVVKVEELPDITEASTLQLVFDKTVILVPCVRHTVTSKDDNYYYIVLDFIKGSIHFEVWHTYSSY